MVAAAMPENTNTGGDRRLRNRFKDGFVEGSGHFTALYITSLNLYITSLHLYITSLPFISLHFTFISLHFTFISLHFTFISLHFKLNLICLESCRQENGGLIEIK